MLAGWVPSQTGWAARILVARGALWSGGGGGDGRSLSVYRAQARLRAERLGSRGVFRLPCAGRRLQGLQSLGEQHGADGGDCRRADGLHVRAAGRVRHARGQLHCFLPPNTLTVAMPSGYGSFSSTTKCWRMGTASSTPSSPAVVSQAKDCHGESVRWKETVQLAPSMSNAASSTHMKAVCAAAVPAVCTMLFSQRL